jgi:hypothetical protein
MIHLIYRVTSAIARFIYSTQSKQNVIEVIIDNESKSITYFSNSSNPDPNPNPGFTLISDQFLYQQNHRTGFWIRAI